MELEEYIGKKVNFKVVLKDFSGVVKDIFSASERMFTVVFDENPEGIKEGWVYKEELTVR